MKKILTKEEVAKAMSDLVGQGKRATLTAIHEALGRRGSMTTVIKLKAEIDAQQVPGDSPEALQNFRAVWSLAVAEGHKQRENEIDDLQTAIATLSAENDRLEGVLLAAQKHAEELEQANSKAAGENRELGEKLGNAKDALSAANSEAKTALRKLTDAQEEHASQLSVLQEELKGRIAKAHELELQLTRANALLDANKGSK